MLCEGYKKLEGTISKTGLGISFAISIIMLIVSEFFALGVDIYREFSSMSFIDSLRSVPYFLEYDEIVRACVGNLLYGLIFMLIAGIMYIKNVNKEIKMSGVMKDFN